MSQLAITLFFVAIFGAIGIAMFVHTWLDKSKIRKKLDGLVNEISGKVIQDSIQTYPRFSGEVDGRPFELFFEVVKVGRKFILYAVYSLKSEITCSLLLLKSDAYKPISSKAEPEPITDAGAIVSDITPDYQIRSGNADEARAIFERAGLKERLPGLSEFSTLQLGPNALVVGKPYDGLADAEPANIMRNVRSLVNLAKAIEGCQVSA